MALHPKVKIARFDGGHWDTIRDACQNQQKRLESGMHAKVKKKVKWLVSVTFLGPRIWFPLNCRSSLPVQISKKAAYTLQCSPFSHFLLLLFTKIIVYT